MVVVKNRFASRNKSKYHGVTFPKKARMDFKRKFVVYSLLLLVIGVSIVGIILVITIKYVHNDSWGPSASGPKVTITQGALRGIYSQTRKGRNIVSFLGIPYAAPPIGTLRFRVPQPPFSWLGTRVATEDGPQCLQPSQSGIVGEEDCLYLNVHTPQLPDESKPLFPVMVWIHGGGFYSGTGNTNLFKPTYLLDHDIVLVTFNYRLGPLGFLSSGDNALPGNYGLKDQVLALVWVRNNIASFGGDPNNVTIVGGSAGGASVQYHMISPLSRGLFHKAISQSGSAISSYALASSQTARSRAERVAQLLDCPEGLTTETVVCLRNKNASLITSMLSEFQIWGGIPNIAFPPVVEYVSNKGFLPETPLTLLKANKSASVPWITGVNAQDGCLVVEPIFSNPSKVNKFNHQFDEMVLGTLSMDGKENSTEIGKEIRLFYFNANPISNNTINELINLYSDSYFMYPMNRSVELQLVAGSTNTYMYYFTYVGSASNSIYYGDVTRRYGACHGDELIYMFPLFPNMTKEDDKMVDIMTSLWTNFARTGKPTSEVSELIPVTWDPVTISTRNYLEIGHNLYRRSNLLPVQAQFWHYVYHWVYKDS